MAVTCFLLESTGFVRIGLRRYRQTSQDADQKCPRSGGWGYHGGLAILGMAAIAWSAEKPDASHWFEGPDGRYGVPQFTYPAHDDPRWPLRCECGEPFTDDDPWQEWSEALYQRGDAPYPCRDSDVMTLRDAPDGAMWDARTGTRGRDLMAARWS